MPNPTPHVPTAKTRGMVMALSGFGIEQEHIAGQIGVSLKTLRKHYKREIEQGTSKVVGDVAGSLYKKAMDPKGGMPSVTAAIWITKTRGKWRETIVSELSGADGSPLPVANNTVIVLPDNGRDPELVRQILAPPMKLIEAKPIKQPKEAS